jgi:hypothetical protein
VSVAFFFVPRLAALSVTKTLEALGTKCHVNIRTREVFVLFTTTTLSSFENNSNFTNGAGILALKMQQILHI